MRLYQNVVSLTGSVLHTTLWRVRNPPRDSCMTHWSPKPSLVSHSIWQCMSQVVRLEGENELAQRREHGNVASGRIVSVECHTVAVSTRTIC